MIEINVETFKKLRPIFQNLWSTCSDFPPMSGYWMTEWFCGDLILGVEEWRNDEDMPPRYYIKKTPKDDDND